VISVVAPIYNEAETLPELCRRVRAVLETDEEPWEIVLVNDGSDAECTRAMRQQHADDSRVKIVELSRNFGHQQALSAGIASATGQCVIVMDGDLQDPPEVIPELLAKWREGNQVVFAERRSRKDGGGARGLGFRLFYPLLRLVGDFDVVDQAGVFGLMDRVVVDEFNRLEERNRYIPGLRSWLGFRQTGVRYDRAARPRGEPKQSLTRLMKYAMDALVSFSNQPLRAATWMGFMVSVGALALATFYFITFFTMNKPITGFTTTIVCVLFLGGVQLICVGILGEYIGRIYEEVKRRPLYVVQSTLGIDQGVAPPNGGGPSSARRSSSAVTR
jgi:dolichol-phosphate mannosyltransferase